MRIWFLIPALLLISGITYSQGDTLFLDIQRCHEIALKDNYSIRTANAQYNFAINYRKSTRTQYFGQLSFVGNYQLTNKPFQILNDNIFMPVVPFWAIDQTNMELSDNILENPLQNGIVVNPVTGQPLTDADGNPVFMFYSYLPADQMKFGTQNNFVFGPNFTQPLYLGGKIRSINKIAESGLNIASSKLNIEKSETIFKIEEAYWRSIDLQEQNMLINTYITLLDTIYYDIKNLFDEGIVTRAEVLQVELKINEAMLNQSKLNNGLILSNMSLCQVLGLPVETPIVLTEKSETPEILQKPEAVIPIALTQRPEIDILDEALKIANAQEDIFRSRFLPNASLSANYMFMNPNPYKGFSNSFGSDWTVGISLQIPLVHWGDRIYTMRSSSELSKIAEIKKEEAESLISLEVQQAWFSYTEAVKKLELRQKGKELANESLRIANDNFNEGMIKVSELLEVQTNWLKAQTDLIEAQTQLKICETEYRKKSGQIY